MTTSSSRPNGPTSSSSSEKPTTNGHPAPTSHFLNQLTSYPVVSDALTLITSHTPPMVLKLTHTVTAPLLPIASHLPGAATADHLATTLLHRVEVAVPLITAPTEEIVDTLVTTPLTNLRVARDTYTAHAKDNLLPRLAPLDPWVKPLNDVLVARVVDKLPQHQSSNQPNAAGSKTYAEVSREGLTTRQRRMGAGDAGGGGIDVNALPTGGASEKPTGVHGEGQGRTETQVERLGRVVGDVIGWVGEETKRREKSRNVGVVRGGIGAMGGLVEKVVWG